VAKRFRVGIVFAVRRKTWQAAVTLAALFIAVTGSQAAPSTFTRPATPAHPKLLIVTPELPDTIWLYREFQARRLIPILGQIATEMEQVTDGYLKGRLRRALVGAGLDVQGQLHADLWSALRSSRYDAVPVKVTRITKQGQPVDLEESAMPAPEDEFAILDVIVLHYGYFGVDTLTNIEPALSIKARLVAGDRKNVLFEKMLSWNAHGTRARLSNV
jgi:hypothetical protein